MKTIRTVLTFLLVTAAAAVYGQAGLSSFSAVYRQDSATVSSIARYPDSLRRAMFTASLWPQALLRISQQQKETSADFRRALTDESQSTQQALWELARYPDLVNKLAQGGKKSKEEISALSAGYPEKIRQYALDNGRSSYNTLVAMSRVQADFDRSFEAVLKEFPVEARGAYRRMLGSPETFDLLSDNIKTAILLGELYRKDPAGLARQADSMNLALAQQHTRDVEDWKKSLDNDPEAKKELKEAAQEYADQNGYSSSEYNSTTVVIVHDYVYAPYPYWAGYPWWYTTPYWYAYPWWYNWGYYYDPFGNIVVWNVPSYQFSYWYFHGCHHHYYHHHLSEHMYDYYGAHRRPGEGFDRGITQWRKEASLDAKTDWLNQHEGREEAFQNYGKLDIDYKAYQQAHPGSGVSKADYLQAKGTDFPKLSPPEHRADTPVHPVAPDRPVPPRSQQEPVNKWNPPPPPPRSNDVRPVPTVPRPTPAPKPRESTPTPRANPKTTPGKRGG